MSLENHWKKRVLQMFIPWCFLWVVVRSNSIPFGWQERHIKSKRTYAVVIPIVYSSVNLRSYHQCMHTLEFLRRHPHVASYIHTLSVAPRNRTLSSNSKSCSEIETRVAYILEQSAPNLKCMVDFCWDGSCMPKPTTFWHTLQKECDFHFSQRLLLGSDPN